ncbi:MAG: L,D-transpeptidase family protein [Terracidiphilus sp.]
MAVQPLEIPDSANNEMSLNHQIRIRRILSWGMAVSLASLMVALCLLGCSSKGLKSPVSGEQKADRIIVVKSSHTMTLIANGRILKVYKVALGRGSSGPKERAGDNKTPEGEYVIDQKNAKSRFHLALHISYPNAADRKRARAAGVDPGGAIMIHGLAFGFGWLGPLQHDVDWTEGCIAVSNIEIDEIWRLVPVGTPIEIKP